jgi:hypothetical protein
MKKHTTPLALSLLAALITLQSTQAADILVDDFSGTSVIKTNQRLNENEINAGWEANGAGPPTSDWTITGGFLSNSSTAIDNVASEGGVGQVVSYGADANTAVTISFNYDIGSGDNLYLHLWGLDGTYDPSTNGQIVNFQAINGGIFFQNGDAAVTGHNFKIGQNAGGGANTALASLGGSGTYSNTIDIGSLNIAGVTTAGDFEYYMLGFARNEVGTAGTTSISNLSFTSVPEPGTYALLAGLTGLVFVMLRRRR